MSMKPEEYFLWRRKTDVSLPWLRQNLNRDFYEHERSRARSFGLWYDKFSASSTKEGSVLDEVSLYSVPVELSSGRKASISEIGNYDFVGLSVLRNNPAYLIIGLLPYGVRRPDDYGLVRIVRPVKKVLVSKSKWAENALLIEEWEGLPSDYPYLDVRYEKRSVQKLFEEKAVHDPVLSQSFQSPIASAPYVPGAVGGVSLVSLAGASSFAKELLKSVQMMVPPEYRYLPPPASSYRGTRFPMSEGALFRLAERPSLGGNAVVGVYGRDYGAVEPHVIKRSQFSGEYSFFSALSPRAEASSEVWKDLLRRFACNEVSISHDLDGLPEADVDLTRLQSSIDEHLWLQVVNMRQLKPALDAESDMLLTKTFERLKKDFDFLLSDVHKDDVHREYTVRWMLKRDNLMRLSQSFSRSNGREDIDEKCLSSSRNLIVDNFTGFLQNPKFERIQFVMKKKRRSERFELLETLIINNPGLSSSEIYEEVKATKHFKDRADLQGLLDWLHEKGLVIVDRNKRYTWVGKPR